MPFSTRQILRDALAQLEDAGFDFLAGSKSNSICSSWRTRGCRRRTRPGRRGPPEVSLLNSGLSSISPRAGSIRSIRAGADPARHSRRSACRCARSKSSSARANASSPFARKTVCAADTMILFRAAAKQIARRNGYLASFMCRPGLPNSVFQRLASAPVADRAQTQGAMRSWRVSAKDCHALGLQFPRRSAGSMRSAAAAFTTPTVNGYKRYRAYTPAPDRAIWAHDNRGVMVRVLGQPGDPSTHLENRVGEPAANPYLYMASQIYAGLDGMAQRRDPGRRRYALRDRRRRPLPKNLGEALAALRASDVFRKTFGDALRRLLRPPQRGRIRALSRPKPRRCRGRREQTNISICLRAE